MFPQKQDTNIVDERRTAIAYYRYSSHRQGEQSIEGQRAEAVRWAQKNGYHIVKEYIDRAQTGTNDNREQFQLMLRELERIRPAVLILWKVDRMGRNREEVALNKYRCKKNGVTVVYAAENIPNTPEGVLIESMLEGFAEYFSVQLGQNIRRGLRVSAAKCQCAGGKPPLGYRLTPDKRFELDPETVPVVQQIFSRYTAGESLGDITSSLNLQGLKNSRGRPFSQNGLRYILRNERYLGVYTFKNEVRVEGAVPAIIDQDTFAKAKEMLSMSRQTPVKKSSGVNYLLTGKLYCEKCGAKMVGRSGTSSSGKRLHYYACNNQKHHNGCDQKGIRKDRLEPLVIHETLNLLQDDALLEFIADNTYQYYLSHISDDSMQRAFASQLQDVQKRIQNVVSALEDGTASQALSARLRELEAQEMQLKLGLEELKAGAAPELTRDHILFFLHHFRDGDLAESNLAACRRLIKTFVNTIFLGDDTLTITYNYSSNNNSITLSDLKTRKPFTQREEDLTILPPNFRI